jgi:outer membrane protein TolC
VNARRPTLRPARAAATAFLVLALFAPVSVAARADDPSLATPSASAAPLELSLEAALHLALERNLALLLGDARLAGARAEELAAAAARRPRFDLDTRASRQIIDLEAYGLKPAPGESPLVGPFDLLDLRVSARAPLLDAAARDRQRATRARTAAAGASLADARDLVVEATANLYLGTLAGQGRIAAADADLAAAESIARLADDRYRQGAASALDRLRADTALAAARARRVVVGNDLDKTRLALLRTLGLDADRSVTLTTALAFAPLATPAEADLRAVARAHRADLVAARAQLEAAELGERAARELRWPVLIAAGDIGYIGPTTARAERTWSLGADLRVPLVDPGEIAARRAAAAAEIDERRAELGDLERAVDFDLREARLDLEAAADLVATAGAGQTLAERELEVARDRFGVGLANSLDVVTAQQTVAAAHESYLAALYGHNAAKARLARALGLAQEGFAALLEGRTDELRVPAGTDGH